MEIKEDIGEQIISMLGNLEATLEKKVKEREKNREPPISEKKNSHLHLLIETSLMQKVEKEAKDQGVSIAEFVRQRLRENSQLDRIEEMLGRLLKK